MLPQISLESLAKHKTKESCWVAIQGDVYDITDYLDQHPGGMARLFSVAGKDGTKAYSQFHSPELIAEVLGDKCIGKCDMGAGPAPSSGETGSGAAKGSLKAPILVNVEDFVREAERKLPAAAAAWLTSGADDEQTRDWNRNDFNKIALRPRILKDVNHIDTSTTILGKGTSLPLFICPTGITKLAHERGECELTPAAGGTGIIQVVSSAASMPIEQVMRSRISPEQSIFYQLYATKDISKTKELLKRAERAGVHAIWVTVDAPVVGKRERDERVKTEEEAQQDPGKPFYVAGTAGIARAVASSFSSSLKWEDLKWIRAATKLPLVIKGIQSVQDAVRAHSYGVQGIVVSNHGGRAQDTSQSSLLTLMEIRKFAPQIMDGGMEIYLDGGVRRGTDILKALALGATAVGMGRPFVSALVVGGQEAVRALVQIVRSELITNMALVGAREVEEVDISLLNTRQLERDLMYNLKL